MLVQALPAKLRDPLMLSGRWRLHLRGNVGDAPSPDRHAEMAGHGCAAAVEGTARVNGLRGTEISDRPRPDLDAQLDRALQALAAETTPAVDLHGRVMAAIDVQPSERRRIGRFGGGTLGNHGGLLARPVVATVTLAMLAVIVLVWSNRQREQPTRPVTDAGRVTASAGPRTNKAETAPRPRRPDGAAIPRVGGGDDAMVRDHWSPGPSVARARRCPSRGESGCRR